MKKNHYFGDGASIYQGDNLWDRNVMKASRLRAIFEKILVYLVRIGFDGRKIGDY